MALLGLAFRTFVLFSVWIAVWTIPAAALGGGPKLLSIIATASAAVLFGYGLCLEFLIQRWILPRNRDVELSQQLQQDEGPGIRVHVVLDLRPEAYLIRSWWGRGSLVITQGMVLALRPSDLALLVSCARYELPHPELPLRSLGAVAFFGLERLMGRALRSSLLEGKPLNSKGVRIRPLDVLRFQVFYTLGRGILRLTGPSWRSRVAVLGRANPEVTELIARLDRLQRQFPAVEDVPLPALALVGRSSSRTLFPSAM